VPSAAVLARLAQEQDVEGLRFELRLTQELRREAERRADAMAKALAWWTHKFVPSERPGDPGCMHRVGDDEAWHCCAYPADARLHVTPAVVQARLDAEATP
jgi:hypothetical protein